MDIRFIRRDPPANTKNIRIFNGEIDIGSESSNGSVSPISNSPDKYDTLDWPPLFMPNFGVPNAETHRDKIWSSKINDSKRVISQGDLKYDVGDHIIAVLPYYISTGTTQIENLKTIHGTVLDINFIVLNDEDIPRETKLRYSPDNSNYATREKEWAKELIIKNWKESTSNSVQTMVTSYTVRLDQQFILTHEDVKCLYEHTRALKSFPYIYDLKFSSSFVDNDTITIEYQYMMGLHSDCMKFVADSLNKHIKDTSITDVDNCIKKFKLYSGVFVKYVDQENSNRNSGIVNFIIIDHICLSPLDIRFVVKCDRPVHRILAISNVKDFDVRLKYPVNKYKLFHPLERYLYEIVDPNKKDFNELHSVRSILSELFGKIEVFTVKKSLCTGSDLTHSVYQDTAGNVKIVKKGEDIYFKDGVGIEPEGDKNSIMYETPKSSKPQSESPQAPTKSSRFTPVTKTKVRTGKSPSRPVKQYDNSAKMYDSNSVIRIQSAANANYTATGILLSSYVKGLAYPEGHPPNDNASYIFFHSKDYCDLVLDPAGYIDPTDPTSVGNNFLQFVCTSNKHNLFRNPTPDDVILGIPFTCDRDFFKGKINLKWFYPEYQFRLLHLYITTDGQHLHFQSMTGVQSVTHRRSPIKQAVSSKIRNLFKDEYLCIFDLYTQGLSRDNQTLRSDFTKAFVIKYFWWERLLADV